MERSNSVLAIPEIIDSYPVSYVLLDHCKFSEGGDLTHGRVVCSSAAPKSVYAALHRHENSVVIFTGPVGEEVDGAYLDQGTVWETAVEA